MKKAKIISMVVLVVVMIFSGIVAASANEQATHASITFLDGELSWDTNYPQGFEGMNFDFGSNELPLGAITYRSATQGHMLRVKDARSDNTKWYVFASMGQFQDLEEDSDLAFDGVIRLANGQASHDELIYGAGQPIVIPSDGTSTQVVAMPSPFRSMFSLQWTGEDVTLSLSDSEARNVADAAYQSEITWTLVLDD